jgi:hypothetical protein
MANTVRNAEAEMQADTAAGAAHLVTANFAEPTERSGVSLTIRLPRVLWLCYLCLVLSKQNNKLICYLLLLHQTSRHLLVLTGRADGRSIHAAFRHNLHDTVDVQSHHFPAFPPLAIILST